MNYLIDTCVVSELVKKTPDIQVVQWFNRQQPTHLFISSVSIAEIKKGLYKIQLAQPERFEKPSVQSSDASPRSSYNFALAVQRRYGHHRFGCPHS